MKSEKETSELVWLGRRLDEALDYLEESFNTVFKNKI